MVRSDLLKRLHRYAVESENAIREVLHGDSRVPGEGRLDQSTELTCFTRLRDRRDLHEHGALLASLRRLSEPEWLVVNCTAEEAVRRARGQIEKVVVNSKRSFPMPELFTRVLRDVEVRAMQGDIRSLFRVQVGSLSQQLVVAIGADAIDVEECKGILRTLHHLEDVLCYEDLHVEELSRIVILKPMLLINLIRQIVNHNLRGEVITNLQLRNLPLWGEMDGSMLLLVKRLLQEFNLFHPSRGDMKWNSDLIVPAFWQSKTKASCLFGGQPLSLNESIRESVRDGRVVCRVEDTPMQVEETVRVRWEYHFVGFLSETLFDQLVVASYSSLRDRQVGPDWILYKKENSFACRLIVTRNFRTKERVMRLEAVAVGSPPELWRCFKALCESLEKVLRRFRGLVVDRQAFTDREESRNLEDVVADWMEESAEDRTAYLWLPPDLNWYSDILSRTEGSSTQSPERRVEVSTEFAHVGDKRGRQWE